MRRFLHRMYLLAAVVPLALVLNLMVSGTAQAINPPQTTESGVVYYLGGNLSGSIDTFWSTTFRAWGRTYIKPGVTWLTQSRWCGSYVLTMNNSWYCPYDNTIWLDYNWNQGYINRYGDNGGGVLLAHEWGHRIQHLLGYNYPNPGFELHADCLAGMYTRYGISTGRLNNADFYEARNTLYSLGAGDHGTPQQRADWFTYGYNSYSLSACNRALGSSTSRSADAFNRPLSATAR